MLRFSLGTIIISGNLYNPSFFFPTTSISSITTSTWTASTNHVESPSPSSSRISPPKCSPAPPSTTPRISPSPAVSSMYAIISPSLQPSTRPRAPAYFPRLQLHPSNRPTSCRYPPRPPLLHPTTPQETPRYRDGPSPHARATRL